MNKICGLVICHNEEKNIEDCLKSLLWCDEIVIADSFSSDNTLNIAKKYSDKIYQNEWKGFAAQRRFALSKTGAEWIISLDADERCTSELASEIKSLIFSGTVSEDGFEIPRKSFFLNKWIRHGGWYPNYQLRLFRKSKADVTDRLVHESYSVNGSKGRLKNDILHYTVTSVSEFVTRINSYSDLSALEKYGKKKTGFFHLLIFPGLAFLQQYILKGNFLDGREGLMVSKFHMMTKLLNYMKIMEMQIKDKAN